jgi:hypothetical protein
MTLYCMYALYVCSGEWQVAKNSFMHHASIERLFSCTSTSTKGLTLTTAGCSFNGVGLVGGVERLQGMPALLAAAWPISSFVSPRKAGLAVCYIG